MDELRDLMAAYVLGALDDDERRRYEAALEDHPALLTEVEEMRDTLGALATATATDPPPQLRDRVLSAVATEEQIDAAPQPTATPRRASTSWRLRFVAALGAIAITAAAVAGVNALRSDPLQDLYAAEDLRVITVDTPTLSANVAYSATQERVAFQAGLLPTLGPNETFQLWIIDADGPTPAGVFRPDDAGFSEVLLDGVAEPGSLIGLTIEPAGGSPQPTGEILLAEPLDA